MNSRQTTPVLPITLCRYAALQINAHDPPIVPLLLTVITKRSDFAFADPITRPPSRWSAALAEHPSLGFVSGIGDPDSARL